MAQNEVPTDTLEEQNFGRVDVADNQLENIEYVESFEPENDLNEELRANEYGNDDVFEAINDYAQMGEEEEEEEEEGQFNVWDVDGELDEMCSIEKQPELNIAALIQIEELRKWIATQKHLPQDLDDSSLLTFLWSATTLETASDMVNAFYKLRQDTSEIFANRHPGCRKTLFDPDALMMVPLTPPTSPQWIIFHGWLSSPDANAYDPFQHAKLLFTELDILFEENQILGKELVLILDLENFTRSHLNQITRFKAQQTWKAFLAFPARLSHIYLLNAPDFVSNYTELYPPLNFHIIEHLEMLCGFVPKKYLPRDLGGLESAPARQDLIQPFMNRIWKYGSWLAFEELRRAEEKRHRMVSDEISKPKKSKKGEKSKKKKGKKKKKK